ncbi:unnamed protein product [Orchesella dallaii]|uniref:Translation initiation inhibitor n=1 Tax=Orchesella dallaii TaxID=48710 RepID=A0ABP1QPH6_9HEXA
MFKRISLVQTYKRVTFLSLLQPADTLFSKGFKMASTLRKIITTSKIFSAGFPYSPGVLVDKTLYVSGQIGWNLKGELATGIEAQTKLALENMGHVLEVVGANHSNVVKVTVLLADINDMQKMNAVYSTFFKENQPARAAYQVAKLPMGAQVEIEAVAIVGELINAKL